MNNEIAESYASWMFKSIGKGQNVSGVVYSDVEYTWMLEAMSAVFAITPEDLVKAEGSWIQNDKARIKITKNTSKKTKDQAFAEIIVQPLEDTDKDLEERDLHF